jgi:hypothetical protein
MRHYPAVALERAMKVQEVFMQAMAKKVTWIQAAEIMGVSDRTMRWKHKHEKHGYVLDQRWGRGSDRRISVEIIEQVLALYREQYFDFSARPFHEKLVTEHQIQLSYTWVKKACTRPCPCMAASPASNMCRVGLNRPCCMALWRASWRHFLPARKRETVTSRNLSKMNFGRSLNVVC